jgi:hypothetical protein
VSRETLQNTKFLKQIKSIILRRLIQLLQRIANEDSAKYDEIIKNFGGALKLGAIEDRRNSDKLIPLLRFATNQRNATSFDGVGCSDWLHILLADPLFSTWPTRSRVKHRSLPSPTWARPPSTSQRVCSSRNSTPEDTKFYS